MNKLYVFLVFIIMVGCGGDSDTPTPQVEVKNPAKAKLLFPENNSECFSGTIVSETETEVLFQWEASEHTNSYLLDLKELETGVSRTINTVSNSQSIRIKQGTAYSWSITSKGATGSQSAQSDLWKFYNVGESQTSYAPFPAEVIAPTSGSSVDEGGVTLKWEAFDIDGDIQNYKVLVDKLNPPIEVKGQTSATSFMVTVDSGEIYYWQIITNDEQGNTSHSQVFQFVVN